MSIRVSNGFNIQFTSAATVAGTTNLYFVAPEDGVLHSLRGVANNAVTAGATFSVYLAGSTTASLSGTQADALEAGEVTDNFLPVLSADRKIKRGQVVNIRTTAVGTIEGNLLFEPIDLTPALPKRPFDQSKV